MTDVFLSYISLPPTLAIFKCRKYFIVTFALWKDYWSMMCQILLIGIQSIILCYCFVAFVGITSGHFIFAQVSDISISLKGLRNSWQGQAQIESTSAKSSSSGPHSRMESFHCVSGALGLQPDKAACGVQQLSWEGSSPLKILNRLNKKKLDFL